MPKVLDFKLFEMEICLFGGFVEFDLYASRNGKIDRAIKFSDYEQQGIKEYWIIDCDKGSLKQNASLAH
jgi:Putative restriction endonuclease